MESEPLHSRNEDNLLRLAKIHLEEIRKKFKASSLAGTDVVIDENDQLSFRETAPELLESGCRLSLDSDYDGRELFAQFQFSDGLRIEVTERLSVDDMLAPHMVARNKESGWNPPKWLEETAEDKLWAQTQYFFREAE